VTAAEWLDALDQAHAAAMTGEWFATRNRVFAQRTGFEPLISACERRADAAAIVAEHNATPRLVAALRAVLEICAAWEEEARQWLDQAARNEADGFGMTAAAQRENASDALLRADHVRSAVVAALGVETTEAGQ
jgi:hypothetical protein